MLNEEPLHGGNVNTVTRRGSTVYRETGPWTPAVHTLLRALEKAGFNQAPRVLGIDEHGREMLTYLPGTASNYPLPDAVQSDHALVAVARLLRRFHDASAGVQADGWYFPPREPVEVICHGDVAPYNCVFDGADPVGLIDFDTAHPGPRVWDVACAAYRFVPLTDPSNDSLHLPLDEQVRRLRLFCDAYGFEDRAEVLATAVEYVRWLRDLIRTRAAAGDPAFAAMLADRHDEVYDTDLRHIAALAGRCGPAG